MKVALLSSTEFGRICLEDALLKTKDVRVVGVLTTPREIEISYAEKPVEIVQHIRFDDLVDEVIEVQSPINKDTYLNHLERWQPDLILALGWYYMIPKAVRDFPQLGCLGIHASLLPKYRGGAPLTWAIINGEKETGATLFYLEGGVDSGDIVSQKKFSIKESDTIAEVYEKAIQNSVDLLQQNLPLIASKDAPRIQQNETQATYVDQRKPNDGVINWDLSAKQIYDWIRAQTKPYPGAFSYLNGKKVYIWKSRLLKEGERKGSPGELLEASDGVRVCCGDGNWLVLDQIGYEEEGSLQASVLIAKENIVTGAMFQNDV